MSAATHLRLRATTAELEAIKAALDHEIRCLWTIMQANRKEAAKDCHAVHALTNERFADRAIWWEIHLRPLLAIRRAGRTAARLARL